LTAYVPKRKNSRDELYQPGRIYGENSIARFIFTRRRSLTRGGIASRRTDSVRK
jgi:hypothetical protein